MLLRHDRFILFCWGITLILSLQTTLRGELATKPTSGLMHKLPVGADIAVKDVGVGYELTIFSDSKTPLGYKVAESTSEYVTLRDIGGISDKVIPWWAIKSITIMRRTQGSRAINKNP